MVRFARWGWLPVVAVLGSCAAHAGAEGPGRDPAEIAMLRHLPAGATNVLLVPDPLPHLEALLANPQLREVLTRGKLAAVFRRSPGGPQSLDPAIAWKAIDENRQYVPGQIAVAVPDEAMSGLDHLVRSVMLAALCNGAVETGGEHAKTDLPKLQDQLLAELKQLRLPPIVVWTEFRDEDFARDAFRAVRGALESALEDYELKITEQGDSFGVRGRVSDLFPVELLPVVLKEAGVTSGVEEAKALAAAIGRIGFEFGIERIGKGLRAWIGPRPDTGKRRLEPDSLGPLFRCGRDDVVFFRWNLKTLKPAAAGWVDLWTAWEKTPIGRYVAENDEEDLVGDLRQFHRQTMSMGDVMCARVSVEKGAVAGVVHYDGVPAAAPLRGAPICRFIPRGIEVLSLDGTSSMADVFSAYLTQFEDRLAMKSLQYELGGRDEQGERLGLVGGIDLEKNLQVVDKGGPCSNPWRKGIPPCPMLRTTTRRRPEG